MRNVSPIIKFQIFLILLFFSFAAARGIFAQSSEPLVELEEFIAEETAFEESNTLLPNERAIDSIFGSARSLLETPRSLTVINPETMREFDLETVYDLASFVPGGQIVNYFGLPGIPTTRGLLTSIYFNGMQRVWNRNGYPTSFGSLESIDYVKGPPPAFYSAASPGGYVNFIPKSPYFDKFRGSVQFTVGSYEKYNTQIDVGGPTLMFGKPSAWRLSLTYQDAESFYKNFNDDYLSLYASTKVKLNDKVSLFVGGEFYQHRSNENPGWNRVTQELIDHREYVTGSPLNDLTGETITFQGPSGETITVTNSTPGSVSREALETMSAFCGIRGEETLEKAMLDCRGRTFDLGLDNPDALSPEQMEFFALIAGLDNTGNLETTQLSPRDALIDPSDFADADTYLFFFDTIFKASDVMTITNKVFIDAYTREKQSTYGYAEDGENFTIEEKIIVEHRMPSLFSGSALIYGGSIRYEDSKALTDFTAEPFSRPDISKPLTANERVPAGDDIDLNGESFWDPNGSFESKLITYGLFATSEFQFGERFTFLSSGRFDHANWWDRRIAEEAQNGGKTLPSGSKTYFNWSFSPIFKVTPAVSLYATYQEGTSFQGFYVSGTVNRGDTNFQKSSLAEAGAKVSLFENTLYSSLSIFHQDLVNFDDRGGEAVPQRGRGVEFEIVYAPNKWLTLLANASWQEHFFRTEVLPAGFVPLTQEEMVLYGGGPYFDFGGRPNPGGPRYGIPEWTLNAYARITLPHGLSIGFGPQWVDEVAANPDKTLTIPSYITWNGRIAYATEKWEISFSAENIFEEEYFIVSESFSANALITHAPLATWEVTFTYKF